MAASDPAEESRLDANKEMLIEHMVDQFDDWEMADVIVKNTRFLALEAMGCCCYLHSVKIQMLSWDVKQTILGADDVAQLKGEVCCICLAGYDVDDVTRTLPACGHVFHEICVWESIRLRHSCPYCRADVDPGLICEKVFRDEPCTRQDKLDAREEQATFVRAYSTYLKNKGIPCHGLNLKKRST